MNAVNGKRCQLLFGLFHNWGLKIFVPSPSPKDVIQEILDICNVGNSGGNGVARNVFMEVARSHEVREPNDKYFAVISYLTKCRGVNVNALRKPDFYRLVDCLENILLHVCSIFNTPETNVFLHAKLTAKKFNLLWKKILQVLPSNVCSGSVDVIRSFVRRGCDVSEALYRVDFLNLLEYKPCSPQYFNDLLEIFEIFVDHGARVNPLPHLNELPFLQGILLAHNVSFYASKTRPKLSGFIKKCIQRGVDPKSAFIDAKGRKEDLFLAVCDIYEEDDKNQLIEYLCDCGADDSLYRKNGLDLWLRLSNRSDHELTSPRFNETLLLLLRRGLRTSCIDRKGNTVLRMYFHLYLDHFYLEDCCKYDWFRELNEVKFWDVLDALLDTGVQVNHANKRGPTTLRAFKRLMPRGYEDALVTICSKCCEKYAGKDAGQSEAVNPDAELTRVRHFIDRLSPLSS